MSSTNRGADYVDHGAYQTDPALAQALVALVPRLARSAVVLEPSVGGGAFLQALVDREPATRAYHRYQAIDIDPTAPGLELCRREGGLAIVGDFTQFKPTTRPQVIVGNVPYAIPQAPIDCPKCKGTGSAGKTGGDARGGIDRACQKCKATGSYQPPNIPTAERHVRHALDIVDPDGGVVAILLRLAFLETAERIPFWREFPARHISVLAERPSFTGGSTDSAAYALFEWTRGYVGETTIKAVSWKQSGTKRAIVS